MLFMMGYAKTNQQKNYPLVIKLGTGRFRIDADFFIGPSPINGGFHGKTP